MSSTVCSSPPPINWELPRGPTDSVERHPSSPANSATAVAKEMRLMSASAAEDHPLLPLPTPWRHRGASATARLVPFQLVPPKEVRLAVVTISCNGASARHPSADPEA